jgi:hypothetical protein
VPRQADTITRIPEAETTPDAQGCGDELTQQGSWKQRAPALIGTLVPFAGVIFLSLKGGGFDTVIRAEVGLAVWLVLLVAVAIGLLPVRRIGRAGWIALGFLGALAAWTALALGWTESAGRTFEELATVATYLGVFALALAAQSRDGLYRTLGAVGAAIAVVSALALLSRLHPDWFPANDLTEAQPALADRLNYPLNYWNGVAGLIAIGIPLVLAAAVQARRIAVQALAAAALPVMALASYYTFSRGGAIALAVALVVFVAAYPRRLEATLTLSLAALASVLLIVIARQKEALEAGPLTELAQQQGDELIPIVLVVCLLTGLGRVALARAEQRVVLPRVRISRRAGLAALATVAVVAIAGAIAADAPAKLGDAWDEFKEPVSAGSGAERFDAAAGNGRYQYWGAAIDAFESEPLTGIGPGTYQFWWSREGSLAGPIRDAHSLYLEVLGEAGIVGLILVLGLLGTILAGGVRLLRRSAGENRGLLAAGLASVSAFAVAAGTDWLWEIPVIPISALLVGAGILGRAAVSPAEARSPQSGRRGQLRPRVALAAIALPCIAVTAISLGANWSLERSEDRLAESDLEGALSAARTAADLQPYAAEPYMQEAEVLSQQGDTSAAIEAAQKATERETTNYLAWLRLAGFQREANQLDSANLSYIRARFLNPNAGNLAWVDALIQAFNAEEAKQ